MRTLSVTVKITVKLKAIVEDLLNFDFTFANYKRIKLMEQRSKMLAEWNNQLVEIAKKQQLLAEKLDKLKTKLTEKA